MLKRLRPLVLAVTIVSILLSPLKAAWGNAMTSNDRVQMSNTLHNLGTADKVTLLLVRPGVEFRTRVAEDRLPHVACMYETNSPEAISQLVGILTNSIIKYGMDQPFTGEVRVGAIFRRHDEVLGRLYLEDWSEARDVKGHLDEVSVLALADTPESFRKWSKRGDVAHVDNGVPDCQR